MKSKEQIEKAIEECKSTLDRLQHELTQADNEFKYQGGNHKVNISHINGIYSIYNADIHDKELPFRAKTGEKAEQLAQHLHNQAVLCQMVEFVNDGEVPQGDGDGDYMTVSIHNNTVNWIYTNSPILAVKDIAAFEKLEEIFKNQAEKLGVRT